MERWKLEIARMALYMAFPVSLFYIFNQPQYFEKWVINTRRELFPPENTEKKKVNLLYLENKRLTKGSQELIL